MPVAFIAIGALFLIAAVRGTLTDSGNTPGLLTLLKSDFVSTSASGNFLVWMASLWIIGALGYIPGFKPIANALLFLVLLVLFLTNSKASGTGGLFAEFNKALTSSSSGSIGNVTLPTPITALGATPLTAMQPMQTGSLTNIVPSVSLTPETSSNPYVF